MRPLRHLLPPSIRAALKERFGAHFYARSSYSQEGEDLVLGRLLDQVPFGVYLDVGAHHPFRLSNTCLLHQRGWRGINIDARPGSMVLFQRFRPRDINLEIGIAREQKKMVYFMFKEPALNTFDAELADKMQKAGWPLTSTTEVECVPLSEVLDQNLRRLDADSIDVMNVDVEGLDLEVLQSNDWNRFRPRVLVIEILGADLSGAYDSGIGRYCDTLGYNLFAKLHHSAIFVQR